LSAVGIDPVRALYWSAAINGLLAAPLMAVMMLIGRNHRAMGQLTLSPRATIMGWGATDVMFVASAVFLGFSCSRDY
jgi:Mn2+/Fe2+ NRAMP family transporter